MAARVTESTSPARAVVAAAPSMKGAVVPCSHLRCQHAEFRGARRLWRAQTNPYASPNVVRAGVADPSRLKPQAFPTRFRCLLYRTIDGVVRLLRTSSQMHVNSCPATTKIVLMPVRHGRYAPESRRRRSCLTSCALQADTASHGKLFRGPDAAISHDHGSLCPAHAHEESQS